MKDVSFYDPERKWARVDLTDSTEITFAQAAIYILLTLAAVVVCIELDVPIWVISVISIIYYVQTEREKETKELRREIESLRKEIVALKAK